MTKQEILLRLNEVLEECDRMILEAEERKHRNAVESIISFCDGQIDALVTVCIAVEALVTEAVQA